ncbi:MAG: response regulator transcription factor [Flavobacteriaceae bacterium]|nr:response regulator transcription factor [Flavobacteriaceae bacterium]
MTKIAIAEYESDFSDAIVFALADEEAIEIVKIVRNGKQLLEYITTEDVDIVLMDNRMPQINGIEATIFIKKAYPEIKVLILSYHINEKDVANALNAGANGYLSKNIKKSEIMDAFEYLKKDQIYFSQEVHQMYLRSRLSKEDKGVLHLTPREKEILPLLGEGLTSEQIAGLLYLGATTVNTHRANLLQKFKAQNNAELMKKAALEGYLN